MDEQTDKLRERQLDMAVTCEVEAYQTGCKFTQHLQRYSVL